MNILAKILLALAALGGASCRHEPPAARGQMEISRAGSKPETNGAASNFVGAVSVQPLFAPHPPSQTSAGSVTFQPGARSAWHTHPAGQALIITAGTGWIQAWGQPKQTVRAGDVVWTPPGVKHWHGATAAEAMSHTAIQENVDGVAVEWREPVTDEEYGR